WADDLPAAAVPGHQVRLDQARRDFQIGAKVALVEPDGDSGGRFAEEVMFFQQLAVMVLNAIVRSDLRPEHFFQLSALVGPVQSGGKQNEGIASGDALFLQRLQERRQDQAVWHRPRNIADKYAGIAATASDVGKRPTTY